MSNTPHSSPSLSQTLDLVEEERRQLESLCEELEAVYRAMNEDLDSLWESTKPRLEEAFRITVDEHNEKLDELQRARVKQEQLCNDLASAQDFVNQITQFIS
ncbi:unnamed protein product [Blepharisma stoltei]|uniref:Uncharacterized protein n=1 Tax=Blepharisma stoltei TaxID=1481888 RepID=A0AAU9JAK7_9CILI|nr:unnamed protein product [Blepharisma stoltei]